MQYISPRINVAAAPHGSDVTRIACWSGVMHARTVVIRMLSNQLIHGELYASMQNKQSVSRNYLNTTINLIYTSYTAYGIELQTRVGYHAHTFFKTRSHGIDLFYLLSKRVTVSGPICSSNSSHRANFVPQSNTCLTPSRY